MNGTRQPTAKFLVATAMPNALVAGSRAIRDQVISSSLSKLSQSVPVLTGTMRAAKNRGGRITPDGASVQCARTDLVATACRAARLYRGGAGRHRALRSVAADPLVLCDRAADDRGERRRSLVRVRAAGTL